MEIRTKFYIGENLFVLINNDMSILDYWEVFPFYVCGVGKNRDNKTIYWNNYGFETFEENLFATKEQAQKECDKRNGKK